MFSNSQYDYYFYSIQKREKKTGSRTSFLFLSIKEVLIGFCIGNTFSRFEYFTNIRSIMEKK